MSEVLRAVKGMNDILPPESARWEWFEDKVRALMRRYAYVNVRTPVVEPTALFVRSIGEVTNSTLGLHSALNQPLSSRIRFPYGGYPGTQAARRSGRSVNSLSM